MTSRTRTRLLLYINGHVINPEELIKTLRAFSKINHTILQNMIQIIPIKYAINYINLQHGYNQSPEIPISIP